MGIRDELVHRLVVRRQRWFLAALCIPVLLETATKAQQDPPLLGAPVSDAWGDWLVALLQVAGTEGARLASGAVLLLLGWSVGQQILSSWNTYNRRRESDLQTEQKFHQLYGEFREIARLWKGLGEYFRPTGRDPDAHFPADYAGIQPSNSDLPNYQDERWRLFARACAAESGIEAVLMKIAREQLLTPAQSEELGLFRQGFQQLRHAIRTNTPLAMGEYGTAAYAMFHELTLNAADQIVSHEFAARPRSLADTVRDLLRGEIPGTPLDRPTTQAAAHQWRQILRIRSREWEAAAADSAEIISRWQFDSRSTSGHPE